MTRDSPHRWDASPTKGFLMCRRCGLEVRISDRQRGGLGPCVKDRWKTKKTSEEVSESRIICGHCGKPVPKTLYCLNCGNKIREEQSYGA